MKKIGCLFLLFSSLCAGPLLARENYYLGRSPEALLMGDSYTSLAGDEYSLFYNPAALGKHRGFSLTTLDPAISVTSLYGLSLKGPTEDGMDKFKNFPKKDPAGIANRIIDTPLHLQMGITPGLKLDGFGITVLASSKTDVVLRDAIHPVLDVDYRQDAGFIAGYAYTIGSKDRRKNKKKKSSDSFGQGRTTSIGLAVKHITRSSLVQDIDLFGTSALNQIAKDGNDNMQDILRSFGYSKGKAWGFDTGMLHTIYNGRSELNFGLSVLDVFDTKFTNTEGSGKIPDQKMTVNAGMSFYQNFSIFDYTLSLDIRPINMPYELSRMIHAGVQFGFPFWKLMFGISEGYTSYGTMFDLGLIKIMAGMYNVEIGPKYKSEPSKRAVIYLSLLDVSFDA